MSGGHEKSDIRDRIERGFAAWGHMAYRRAGWVIAPAVLATAALAYHLPKLWIEPSTESFFHESDLSSERDRACSAHRSRSPRA